MLSISTTSEHGQSCNRMDQAGRTHFVGHCRHLHTNTHTFDFVCMQASMGQSEKLLPISQHGICSCATFHGLGAMQSLNGDHGYVPASVCELTHSGAFLGAPAAWLWVCLCIPCCPSVYAGRQAGESKKDLIPHNVLFLCPSFFYFVPTHAELQSPPLVFASQCGTLCCVSLYILHCLPSFFPVPLPAHGCLFSLHVWHQKTIWTATIQSKWKGMLLLEDPTEAWAELILNYELAGDFSHLFCFSLFFLAFFFLPCLFS